MRQTMNPAIVREFVETVTVNYGELDDQENGLVTVTNWPCGGGVDVVFQSASGNTQSVCLSHDQACAFIAGYEMLKLDPPRAA